jgi:hypothetical protein
VAFAKAAGADSLAALEQLDRDLALEVFVTPT